MKAFYPARVHGRLLSHPAKLWQVALLSSTLSLSAGCLITTPTSLFDRDGDGAAYGDDCDDNDAEIGAQYFDLDGDGYGNGSACDDTSSIARASVDGDCNDEDPDLFPGAPEVCDGLDNDCNDTIDDILTEGLFADTDQDGFGDADAPTDGCDESGTYVYDDTDCDDADAARFPEASELCNGVDDNCNDQIDEDVTYTRYYPDADGDGHGDPALDPTELCSAPESAWSDKNDDCDDLDNTVYAGAPELCDGLDNDCNAQIDDDLDYLTFFQDADGDGYGDIGSPSELVCQPPTDYVADSTDCNDFDDTIYPQANELCDGRDNDCNNLIDDEVDYITYYPDADGDGYGDSSAPSEPMCLPPTDLIADSSDCDDQSGAVYPSAYDVVGDGEDSDCAGNPDLVAPFAGTGESGNEELETDALLAPLSSPAGLAADAALSIYIADSANHRVRKVDLYGAITTVAGTGEEGFSGDGGYATEAQLGGASAVAIDSEGILYICDTSNGRIRRVDGEGVITTVVGSGVRGEPGDGGAPTAASLAEPSGLAFGPDGALYIADTYNHRIRKVNKELTLITTVAGNGEEGFSTDEVPATETSLSSPGGVALDSEGNLYISDTGNHRVRKVDLAGEALIITVAGNGVPAYLGDGSDATEASLNFPNEIVIDALDNLYIADSVNQVIRMVNGDGLITTVAGGGNEQCTADGCPATEADFGTIAGVAADSDGYLFLSDLTGHQVWIVYP